jgi:hypothetical protein
MRRESSTVVVLVGEVAEGLLAELGRSANVSVARAPAAGPDQAGAGRSGTEPPGAEEPAAARPGWEPGALALREAARRQSPYVIVPEDPLAEVAAAWRAMWDVPGGAGGAARFEQGAADALAAWQAKRFDLPDYYLIMAAAPDDAGSDLYLGPLRAARPRRAVVAGIADRPGQAARVLDTLRSLEHGPWWPPLDELIDAARRFYAGGLTETQPSPAEPTDVASRFYTCGLTTTHPGRALARPPPSRS